MDSDLSLADLVVIATDLRDAGRDLVERADRLYEEVIEIALAVRGGVPSQPRHEPSAPLPSSDVEWELFNRRLY